VGVSFLMESLDVSILNTSVPTVAAALAVSPLQLKAALTCYALTQALFIPVSAWLTDRYGTRRVFAGAIAVFSLGSLLCGVSTSVPMLVGARIVQGMGGAMMMPVGRVAIVRTFPKTQIIRAMSFVVIPGMMGPLLGPVVGSVVAELVHWRAIFLVNLPVGLLGLRAALRVMPDYRSEARDPLDVAGLLLFGGGIASLSHGLGRLAHGGAARLDALGWVGCAAALLALYARHAAVHPRPLLRLGILRRRSYRVAVAGGFLSRLGIGGMPFLLPLFYQVGLGRTPLESALLMLPQPAAAITTKLLQRRVIARLGYRRLLRANTLLIGAAIACFGAVSAATPRWQVGLLAFVYGTVTSLQFTSVNSLQYADLEPAETSMGSTVASVVQQLSLSFGVALASGTAALLLGDAPATAGTPTLATALRRSFLVLGAVTAASSATFALLHPDDGHAVARLEEEPRRAA
jgi:EmrB/QacA subfamily drug resistance transporter